MTDQYTQWIERKANEFPVLASTFSDLLELYNRKLWHQITIRLESILDEETFASDSLFLETYQSFIVGFWQKINLLKLAVFAVAASKQCSSPNEGKEFLKGIVTSLEDAKRSDAHEPALYLRMQIAQYELVEGSILEAKKMLQEGLQELERHEDIDPQVAAAVHFLSMQIHKQTKDYAKFYRSSLLYLAHISLDTLPENAKLAMAVDVSLAALLGKDVYNFGELMLHPIVKYLEENPSYSWLSEMLECFHNGDIYRYDELCTNFASLLNAQPALVENERQLREKITVMSLLQLVESLPAEKRSRIPLQVIAERTKLPLDGVEFLLMKALALHLMEGVIDQVGCYASISWVSPRVLTIPEIQGLNSRLNDWLSKVTVVAEQLQEEAAGVVEI